jgi:hypothetical protein
MTAHTFFHVWSSVSGSGVVFCGRRRQWWWLSCCKSGFGLGDCWRRREFSRVLMPLVSVPKILLPWTPITLLAWTLQPFRRRDSSRRIKCGAVGRSCRGLYFPRAVTSKPESCCVEDYQECYCCCCGCDHDNVTVVAVCRQPDRRILNRREPFRG